jgi:hypothetical protein
VALKTALEYRLGRAKKIDPEHIRHKEGTDTYYVPSKSMTEKRGKATGRLIEVKFGDARIRPVCVCYHVLGVALKYAAGRVVIGCECHCPDFVKMSTLHRWGEMHLGIPLLHKKGLQ